MNSESTRAIDIVNASLKKRYARERRFRFLGVVAVSLGLFFVSMLFLDIFLKGYTAFQQTYIRLQVHYDGEIIDPEGTADPDNLAFADYSALVKQSLRDVFPEVTERRAKRELYKLASPGAGLTLADRILGDPALIGSREEIWVLASDDVDMLMKGHIDREAPEANRRVDDRALGWVDHLLERGDIERGLELVREAADKAPHLPSVRYHLAVGLAKNGRKEDARREVDRLLREHQEFPEIDEARALLAELQG